MQNFYLKYLRLTSLSVLLSTAALSASAQVICPGSTAALDIGTYRGNLQWQESPDQINWTNISGATTAPFNVSPTGTTYYRAVITEGTCAPIYSSVSTVSLSDLVADAGPDRQYCPTGNPVTLGGSPSATGGGTPYTYSWSPAAGLSSTSSANPNATPSTQTDYILTVTDANGCSDSDTVTVTIGSGGPQGDSTVFSFTGGSQFFVVPPCVNQVQLRTWGAQGENALVGGATGGLGGYAFGVLAVTPGETLHVYVGGSAGYNGGGLGGINGNDQNSSSPIGTRGGSGGGASDVRRNGTALANRVIVAAGGGGAGHNGVWQGCQVAGPGGNGGNGGGSTGSAGTAGVGTPCNCGGGGGGGGTGATQSAGGVTGSYAGSTACLRSSWGPGSDGTLGQGGNGSQTSYHNGSGGSGGGGGGYYGGGSGAVGSDTTPGGGGGGGSSYTGGVTNGVTNPGVRTGNGRVVILF